MAPPLRWLRNPKRLSDDDLVAKLVEVLAQQRNARWIADVDAAVWLDALCLTYLHEVERRIAQGTLF